MRRRALSGLVALLAASAVIGGGIDTAAADSYNLSGNWADTSKTTSLILGLTRNIITWQGGPNNRAWIQNFSGVLSGSNFSGTFWQDEPGRWPQRYHGTMTAHIVDNCHFILDSIVQTGQATVSNIEFIKTPCTASAPEPTKTSKPTKIVWPTLPDALVPLETVSNGCGGGDAGTNPMWGDDSKYVNSEIPFADDSSWSKELKYSVNFREACKQHDAAYSHAKVKEMALNGGQIVDYFTWTKKKIDDKFLIDMIKICDASIPKAAKVALNNCKNNGGFHTVSGAKTRYNVVASTTYSQKIYRGLGFYQEAPALTGTWVVSGVSTGPWSFYQSTRSVNVKWTGGSGQPNLKGEFRGTIISHDADSTIEGFYVITNNGAPSSIRAMSFSWSPKTPDQLRSSTGIDLKRS